MSKSNWLERWLKLIDTRPNKTALDIGCGGGDDTRFLAGMGWRVVGIDISARALSKCKEEQPDASFLQVDISQELPFSDICFDLMVANLSLHFFNDLKTKEVLGSLRDCLKNESYLFARFNSTRDIHPRIAREPELEPNFFQVGDITKRFFNREMILDLFQEGWQIENPEEIVTSRKEKPKVVWEVIARKV